MLIKTDRERVLRLTRRVWQDLLTAVLRDPTIRFAQAGVDALSSAQSILLCAGPFVPSAEPPSGQASGDLAFVVRGCVCGSCRAGADHRSAPATIAAS